MKYEKSKGLLKNEYLAVFHQIELYAIVSNMLDVSEEILCDMVEILLTAQKNKTPVMSIAGNNPEEFCESLFSSITKEDKRKIIYKRLFKLLTLIFFLEFVPFIMNIHNIDNAMTIQSNILTYFIPVCAGALLFYVTNYYFKTHMFKWKKSHMTFYYFINVLEFVLLIVLLFCIPENWTINVPTISIISLTLLYMIIYVCLNYSQLFMKRTFLKKKSNVEIESDEVIEEKNEVEEQIEIFECRNKRLSKKGKKEIKIDAYMKKSLKDSKICIGIVLFFTISLFAGTVGNTLHDMFQNSYTFTDFLVDLSSFIIVIGGFVYFFSLPQIRKNHRIMQIIEHCLKQNLNLYEYRDYLDSKEKEDEASLW